MCGIAGIINKNKQEVPLATLKLMTDVIEHRGPDGEGHFIEEHIGFGHRRLAIIDLSEAGHQPMAKEDLVITYNGEIYNYIELRKELESDGYRFTTKTDTEVILKAYQAWGESCVQRFNGMWAFAIFDKSQNKIFISRDRFGIKPFYYHENDEAFFFGSEIGQLLPHLEERKVHKQVLFDFLYLGYHHHTENTFFEGILSLDPGHNLIFNTDSGTFKIEKYYELKPNKEVEALSFDDALVLFRKTMDDAIALRLRSDVKVGTCLSGGMDSSYIAATASESYREQSGDQFTAITAKSVEKGNDESHFAKMVVDAANLDWKITEPTKDDFLKAVDQVIATQQEPFGSPSIIMAYFVMEKAKKEGCTVLLDGQGGDESLLGYERYYTAFINQQPNILKKVKSALKIAKNSKLSLKDILLYNVYFNNASIRAARQTKRYSYIKSAFKKYVNKPLLKEIAKANKDIHTLQEFEITKIQMQKLLKYEDRNSMHFSIETRVPFVDYKVVELAYSLPFSYKMHEGWSKYILRKSAKDRLPDEIVWRRNKFGFEAPTKTWLSDKESLFKKIKESGFIKEFVDVEKLSESIDDLALWKLFNIAVWAQKFNVKF
jgi:asparagine synthase (glutamine-hydrolysing)